jgi:lambda family phage portal protein
MRGGRLATRIAKWLATPPAHRRVEDAGPGMPGFPTGDAVGSSIGFEGGSVARRLSPWRPTRAHINTLLAAEGPLVRARTRQLIANAPYAASASDAFVAYATGTGIVPSWQIENEEQKFAVQKAFLRWTDEADADGLTDFYGLQSLAARALFDAGEVFVRLRPRRSVDGLTVPMQLQLLEAEQLDSGFTMAAAGGNVIRMGIEFNPIGQRVAYHFWRNHPGDMTVLGPSAERVRVPAEYVLHVFKPLRAGQIRGRPWLTASMIKLHDLDQYDDAELARKKGAAMFMAFLVRGLDADPAADIPVDAIQAMNDAGLADLTMEPSVIQELPPGLDVKFNQPADVGPNYEPFQFRTITQALAATGMPYHSVTGDTSKANYSSLRSAQLEPRRRIEQFQNETLIFQLCRPVGRAWLPAAILSGAVSLPGFARDPEPYLDILWQTPRWDYVDPLKDAQAEELEVDNGFRSRSSVIRSKGLEPEAVDAEIAADRAREKRLGLTFTKAAKPPPTRNAPPGEDGQVPPGDSENLPESDQPAAAAFVAQSIVDAIGAQPQPIINVVPRAGVERTRVTKHDDQGRILEFEKEEVA